MKDLMLQMLTLALYMLTGLFVDYVTNARMIFFSVVLVIAAPALAVLVWQTFKLIREKAKL